MMTTSSDKPEKSKLPIPDRVHERLPKFLNDINIHFTLAHERDVFLTAALPIMANSLKGVVGCHHDGLVAPNLYTFIVAPSASGKGVLRFARELGLLIENRFQGRSLPSDEAASDLEAVVKPLSSVCRKTFFLPGNTSETGLLEALVDNGGSGVIVESEMKTLLSAMKNSIGDLRYYLLNGFHQEQISKQRKGVRVFVPRPTFSIVASGTPEDVVALIPNLQDGLFSRFAFYSFEAPSYWKTHRPTNSGEMLQQAIQDAAVILNEINTVLSQRGTDLVIELPPGGWDHFDAVFDQEMNEIIAIGPAALEASVKRSAHIAFRIACILTTLDAYETGSDLSKADRITADLEHVEIAVELAVHYLQHAKQIAASLYGSKMSNAEARKEEFIARLPLSEFSTDVAHRIGTEMGMSKRTINYWLVKLVESGTLIRLRQGMYARAIIQQAPEGEGRTHPRARRQLSTIPS